MQNLIYITAGVQNFQHSTPKTDCQDTNHDWLDTFQKYIDDIIAFLAADDA